MKKVFTANKNLLKDLKMKLKQLNTQEKISPKIMKPNKTFWEMIKVDLISLSMKFKLLQGQQKKIEPGYFLYFRNLHDSIELYRLINNLI